MAGRSGSTSASTEIEHALTDLLQPVLAGHGLVVEEVRLVPAGKRKVLKVLIDRDPYADGAGAPDTPVDGLSLDEVADASRTVSSHLDDLTGSADPLDGAAYTLEVSSPGVDRPLTLPRHFRRNVGRMVDLRTADGSSLRCRIAAATPDDVTVLTGHGPRQLTWAEVQGASVQVEFKRPPAPAAAADEEG